jgi:hydrogenase maturation protein HypF
VDRAGTEIPGNPVDTAVQLLRGGALVGVKGIGGFHLAADAANDAAIRNLRARKERPDKPFALMSPSLEAIASFASFEPLEGRLLSSPERPIVLIKKKPAELLSPQVAPGNGYLGVMLPSSPLHHLLLQDNFIALIMTSGNRKDEPMAHTNHHATQALSSLADFFLLHDRDIHQRCDDSVLRLSAGEPLFLRRSRGYVPRSITLPAQGKHVLALGGELKTTLCLTRGDQAYLSQHLGDMKNVTTIQSMHDAASHLQSLLGVTPEIIAHDLHPDYETTIQANMIDLPRLGIQHHHAHLAACMAEHRLNIPVIGVIFDGTGYGTDGTIWGGEFLLGDYRHFERRAFLKPVPMPGGDIAITEPFRMALSHLFTTGNASAIDLPLACFGAIDARDKRILLKMLEQGINSPLTSSCGRLFDAVAAILGIRSHISYEAQAAIELEALAETTCLGKIYPYQLLRFGSEIVIDTSPMVVAIAEEVIGNVPISQVARGLHLTLAELVADVCSAIAEDCGIRIAVLSGGVFQNRLLTDFTRSTLSTRGFTVYSHRLVPPNDGGLSLGQAMIAGLMG